MFVGLFVAASNRTRRRRRAHTQVSLARSLSLLSLSLSLGGAPDAPRGSEVYWQSRSDWRSVSTTPCQITPPLGARAPAYDDDVYLLFLQEQIKGIIIREACPTTLFGVFLAPPQISNKILKKYKISYHSHRNLLVSPLIKNLLPFP
jgi:hypothetical protein